MTYQDQLKTGTWWKTSLNIKYRDGFRCTLCPSRWALCVHHLEYHDFIPENTDPKMLKTVCERCHGVIHFFWKYTREFPISIDYNKIENKISSGSMKMDKCEFVFNYPVTNFYLKEY